MCESKKHKVLPEEIEQPFIHVTMNWESLYCCCVLVLQGQSPVGILIVLTGHDSMIPHLV